MPAVTIPGVGRVNFPNSMSIAEIQAASQKLAGGVGIDHKTGQYNADLAILDELRTGPEPTGKLDPSLSDAIANTNWTPITLGTIAAIGTGGGSFWPSVAASGLGGGAGGALVEAREPDATSKSIGIEALKSGALMAGSEAASFGLGALANKMIAPNLARYADPMKPVRERIAETGIAQGVRDAVSNATSTLPPHLQRAAKFASSPVGGELLEAAAVPLATMTLGPAAGAATYIARAALAPGPLARYLSRSKLPDPLIRALSRHALTTAGRVPLFQKDKGR